MFNLFLVNWVKMTISSLIAIITGTIYHPSKFLTGLVVMWEKNAEKFRAFPFERKRNGGRRKAKGTGGVSLDLGSAAGIRRCQTGSATRRGRLWSAASLSSSGGPPERWPGQEDMMDDISVRLCEHRSDSWSTRSDHSVTWEVKLLSAPQLWTLLSFSWLLARRKPRYSMVE